MRSLILIGAAGLGLMLSDTAAAVTCDLSSYKPARGLKAEAVPEGVRLRWPGRQGQELRATFVVQGGAPVVEEMAARRPGGAWITLGRNLRPEFLITSGKRRISNQQLSPLRQLGLMSEDFLEKEKWKVFWDAPLMVPGVSNTNPGPPRKADEIRRSEAQYNATGCAVKTDGARLEVSFPGLTAGIFSGRLQYTVYSGTNLLRQEAVAKTDEPSVAYQYRAGMKGFPITDTTKLHWRDVARGRQWNQLGGGINQDPVALRARNRLLVLEAGGGSLAAFPAPHKFFWAREIELNLGYVWYRKDDEKTFSLGIRNGEKEEMYRPFGYSDEVWDQRLRQARHFAMGNFALYNA
ncbi:MAG: hypothetical protein FJW20_27045, partial [Acidimicrobiia bacterium]|nr:hypothetical protein [Acidimicrobiia bacterium]